MSYYLDRAIFVLVSYLCDAQRKGTKKDALADLSIECGSAFRTLVAEVRDPLKREIEKLRERVRDWSVERLKIDDLEERVLPDLIERIQNLEQRVAVLEHEFRQHVESIPHEPPAGE